MSRRKKVIVEKFEPTGQQFDAVVQGVYESQVKKHLGKKSTTPFKDRSGIRLDEKFILDQETVSKLLGSAFSIATAQGQKLGTLKKGTQTATAKGRAKAAARMKDKKKLAENIADYEYTLSLARKSSPYRIVEKGRGRGKRFIVQPLGKEYKTLSAAKACITRERKKGGIEDLPMLDNPFGWFKKATPKYQLFEIAPGNYSGREKFERYLQKVGEPSDDPQQLLELARRFPSRGWEVIATTSTPRKYYDPATGKDQPFEVLWAELEESLRQVSNPSDSKDIQRSFYGLISDAKRKRKPMGSNAEYSTWVSQRNYAKSRGLKDASRVRFKRGGTAAPEPIAAYPVLKTVYHDWMTDEQGIPFPMYRRAPIARYWTIELYGPKWRFERFANKQRVKFYDERFWEGTDWGGYRGYKLQERSYQPYQRKGTDEIGWAARQSGNNIMSLSYRVGRDRSASAGFNTRALGLARNAVREAYAEWYEKHQSKLQGKKQVDLVYPKDALQPTYPKLLCRTANRDIDYFVLDPKVHLGVLVRAIVCVIQMQQYKGNFTTGGTSVINTSEISNFLQQYKLTSDVKRAIDSSGVFGDDPKWLVQGLPFPSVINK